MGNFEIPASRFQTEHSASELHQVIWQEIKELHPCLRFWRSLCFYCTNLFYRKSPFFRRGSHCGRFYVKLHAVRKNLAVRGIPCLGLCKINHAYSIAQNLLYVKSLCRNRPHIYVCSIRVLERFSSSHILDSEGVLVYPLIAPFIVKLFIIIGGRLGTRTLEAITLSCFQDSVLGQPDTFHMVLCTGVEPVSPIGQ